MSARSAPIRILSASDLDAVLPVERCIDAVAAAMLATSAGEAVLPLRTSTALPGTTGRLILMPGWLARSGAPVPAPAAPFGVKIVAKFARAPGDPLGTHVGAVLLFDAGSGALLAMLEGGTLTALRTAAASALATRVLARSDADVAAVLGTGEQAWRHALALPVVRPLSELRLWGRTRERAEALASRLRAARTPLPPLRVCATVREAVDGAGVVCTTTSSAEPILCGAWLEPGTHVNLVGAAVASAAEVDVECVRRARVYVDYRASADAEAGELRQALATGAIGPDHVVGELGEVLLGRVAGRLADADVTLYKSLGIAAQDLAAAAWAYAEADRLGVGAVVDLGA